MIFAPRGYTAVVGTSMLVIDDEWVNAVAQALLQHYQTTDSAIIVLKGMNLFKANIWTVW